MLSGDNINLSSGEQQKISSHVFYQIIDSFKNLADYNF